MSHLEAQREPNKESVLSPAIEPTKRLPALRLVKSDKNTTQEEILEGKIPEIGIEPESNEALSKDERWVKSWGLPEETKLYHVNGKGKGHISDEAISLIKDGDAVFHVKETFPQTAEEELSKKQRENGITVSNLYKEFNEKSSETGAGEKRSEILKVFHDEENELKNISEGNQDPVVRAFIATRRLELAKMKMELEIKWLQKQMWDLGHNWWSPEKIALQNQVDVLEFDNLRPLLEKTILALKSERDLLIQQNGSPIGPQDWSPRLNYVVGRLIGLEDSLRKLDAAAGNRKPQ